MPTETVTMLPGAHFYIKGLLKRGTKNDPIAVEIDLGESIDLGGHSVCAAVVSKAITRAMAEALAVGPPLVRRIESAPHREQGPGLISIKGSNG